MSGQGGAAARLGPLAVPTVTAHPSTASVLITVLLYDGPLLCGFNVAVKGLTASCWIVRGLASATLCRRCSHTLEKEQLQTKQIYIFKLLSIC